MKIFCQKINGEVLELDVATESSIYDVKEKIASLASPDEAQAYPLCQRLMKDGTALENTQDLSSLASDDLQLTLLITMDGVVEALGSPEEAEKQELAVEILRNIGTCDSHVLVALGAFLKTAKVSPKVLADVATVLIQQSQISQSTESSEALESVLLGSLNHRSWRIREAGIQGLIHVPGQRKVTRLIEKLTSRNQKRMDDDQELNRNFSTDMAAVEALGSIAPAGHEATLELFHLLLQRQGEFRQVAEKLRCLEILLSSLGHFCFESNSKEAKTARGLAVRFYCYMSHELLLQSVHNWTPRRRPDWKAIMVPLAKQMLRGASLSPEVMRDLFKEMVNTSYCREVGFVGFRFRIMYMNEHLSPTSVRLALRELIVASGNDVSEVMPLLSHPYDAIRATAAYIIVRRNEEASQGLDDVLSGLRGPACQEILAAVADALDAQRFDSDCLAPGDDVVAALRHLAGDASGEVWLRLQAFRALCAAQMAPKEMVKAWIAGNAMEAEAAVMAIDTETGQEFLCQALDHWDAEIRRLALVKLSVYHQLHQCVHCLAIETDRKQDRKTNYVQLVPPSAQLKGGDATVKGIEKLLENPEEKRQVLMSCMGILAGLARARHLRAIEVLCQLKEAKRRYPQSMAVAILDDLKEPYRMRLPSKQWRSSGLKALEDRSHRWADPGFYDRAEGMDW